MKNCFAVSIWLLGLVFSLQALAQRSIEIPGSVITPIKDKQNQRQYELLIKLPESYAEPENSTKHYPVIYTTDAVMHMELLSAASFFLMEDVILVGISYQKDNNPALVRERGEMVSRFRDYSVWRSDDPKKQAKYQFGQADQHLSFIRNDVFNYVESTYRTQPNNRAYFGYSLGGLFGAHILLSQPDTFRHYMLGSPSVWRLEALLKGKKPDHDSLNANVFVSRGSQEEELGQHIEAFLEHLRDKKDSSMLLHNEVIAGDHNGAAPGSAVRAVQWLAQLSNTSAD